MHFLRSSIRYAPVLCFIVLMARPAPAAASAVDLGGKVITHLVYDSTRNYLYATATATDSVLFIDCATMTVIKSLYVGKSPKDLEIEVNGNVLYVGNDGQSPGVPGSANIAVVDLGTQTLTKNWPIPVTYVNNDLMHVYHVKAGRAGHLYYDGGFMYNGGTSHQMNTTTGVDMGGFDSIKTNMVMNSTRTRLYGQRIYDGNLGNMGLFDVTTDNPSLTQTNMYPPYPYGWSGDNPYVMSGDGTNLIYDSVLFNAANLAQTYGTFTENIYALNANGKFAVGEATFGAARLSPHREMPPNLPRCHFPAPL